MPQNGTGVQGGGWLPGNMQQHQPQVVPTSALEGCSTTAFRRHQPQQLLEDCSATAGSAAITRRTNDACDVANRCRLILPIVAIS